MSTPAPTQFVIWSVEHQAWWKPEGAGYTFRLSEAAQYDRADAEALVSRGDRVGRADQRDCAIPLAALGPLATLGETGTHPEGHAGAADEGELRVAIAADYRNSIVRLEFGKAITWIGLPAQQARALAHRLQQQADALDRRRS